MPLFYGNPIARDAIPVPTKIEVFWDRVLDTVETITDVSPPGYVKFPAFGLTYEQLEELAEEVERNGRINVVISEAQWYIRLFVRGPALDFAIYY